MQVHESLMEHHLFVVPKVCGLNLLCVLQRPILRDIDVQQTLLAGHLLANTSDLPVLVANAEDVRGINTCGMWNKKDAPAQVKMRETANVFINNVIF